MLITLFKTAVLVLIVACVGLFIIPSVGVVMFLGGVIGVAFPVLVITTIGMLLKKREEIKNSKLLKYLVWLIVLTIIFVAGTFLYSYLR